jgi:voltage-gated potassium channel
MQGFRMTARAQERPPSTKKVPVPTGFDVFVLALSILSLINILLVALLAREDVVNVVLIVDGVICLVFLADFLWRLHNAPSKRGYFIGDLGWLDLLGSIPLPGLRLARLFRVVRVGRSVRFYGLRGLRQSAAADRAGSSLLGAVFLTIVVLQYGSMAILRVEDEAEGSNIHTASDALWWSYVTITTVGYGDRFPVTDLGRNIGVAVLTIGVGLFGVLTGFLANLFLAPRRAKQHGPTESAPDLRLEVDELRRLIADLRAQTLGTVESDAGDPARHGPAASTPSPGGRLDHGRS